MATVYEEHSKIGKFFSSHSLVAIYTRRPWTAIADLVTGVVKREESSTYDSALLREWLKGAKSVRFKDVPGEPFFNTKRYHIEGAEHELVASIDSLRSEKNESYGMQSLRLRDGTVKITINRSAFSYS